MFYDDLPPQKANPTIESFRRLCPFPSFSASPANKDHLGSLEKGMDVTDRKICSTDAEEDSGFESGGGYLQEFVMKTDLFALKIWGI